MTEPETNRDNPNDHDSEQPGHQTTVPLLLKIIIGGITFLLTLTLLVWLSFPVPDLVTSWISSRYTPTPLPPTATPYPTKVPTITPTPTLSPTITPTLLPPSSYQVADLSLLVPEIPSSVEKAVVLDEATSVTAVPAFDNIQWTHSSQISNQIGVELSEPYYATFGPGSATWMMDSPLDPGLYELFVLDTLFSSGGVLDFTVKLGQESLVPLAGSTRLEYKSSQGNPPQRSDIWRSIGIYDLKRPDILSVSTAWELRNELTIVAIDRLMIAKVPESLRTLLEPLPKGQMVYIMDDSNADMEALQYWQVVEEGPAWGDKYYLLINPPIAVRTTWTLPERVPKGKYEVLAWIPKIRGTAAIKYMFLVEGSEIEPTGEIPPVTLQGDEVDPHWQPLGIWQVPDIFEDRVQLALELDIDAEAIGETAVDAVAFIPVP